MTYSLDFRKKVLSVKATEGLSFVKTSKRFRVGVSSILRWTKNSLPKLNRNKPCVKLDMEALKQDIVLYPDAYQYERAERLGVSSMGIWHALKRLKVTYKKNTQTSQSRFRKTLCFLPKAESL